MPGGREAKQCMEQYLLGIDIGTSGCKAAVFDRAGNAVAWASSPYPVVYPREGWAEQDPRLWWKEVCRTVKKVLYTGEIRPESVIGIGVDGQSWSAVLVDGHGEVLTNTPIWMDKRAEPICREITARINEKELLQLCGNPFQAMYTTPKLLWYQKELPDIYRCADKVLQSNSFIVYKLTGQITQDVSQGYGFHCFDMKKGSWDVQMCGRLGIPRRLLPDIFPCDQIVGRVTAGAAAECGLVQGIPVVAGGLDAACGALGTGVLENGETQEQGGQAGGMSICMDHFQPDPRLILSFHVVPSRWLLQGGTTGGGGVMRWLVRELGEGSGEESETEILKNFNHLAENTPPGSDGLVFLPYMAGERSPIWDSNAKGVYYGLDYNKTKGHLLRAAMEGVAFSLRHNLDVAGENGAKVGVLRAMGGSANSWLWTQIKADVTGKPIIVPSSDTATTLGAAMLAGVGTGFYADYKEAVRNTVRIRRFHQPEEMNRGIYQKNYEKYRLLYEELKQFMKGK